MATLDTCAQREPELRDDRTSRRRPGLLWAVSIVVVALVIGGTWWVAGRVQSPAQREAAAAPPSVSTIHVAVTRGELRDEITAASTVTQSVASEIALPLPDGQAVVTRRLVEPGNALQAGQALLHLNGRPLFALPGSFPAYRDVMEGDHGDDVAQLQRALQNLGYNVRADGDFGAVTASAVRDFYHQRGYTPLESTSNSPANRNGGESSRGTQGANTETAQGPADSSAHTSAQGPDGPTGQNATSGQSSQNTQNAQSGQGSTSGNTTQTSTPKVRVPRSEIVYIASLLQGPTLNSIPGEGDVLEASSAKLSLAAGQARVEAEMPKDIADSLTTGAKARATTSTGELTLTLEQIKVKEKTEETSEGTSGAGGRSGGHGAYAGTGPQMVAVFSPDAGAFLPTAGTALVLTVERTPLIENTLLVPKRALASINEQTHRVLLKQTDGAHKELNVELRGCVGGQCAVNSTELKEGDELKVDPS